MRCLEKDRTHRYQTANSLAQDVERYLNNEPIEARRPTRIYRLKKFVRRNKLGVLAGSAIALALFVGLTLAMGGFLRARQQTEIARGQAVRSEEVSRFLQDMLAATGPSVARGRDTTLLREILDDTAQRIAGDLNDQPAVKAELYFTLGTTYGGIGDYLTAVTMLEQAVGNYRRAFGNDSADTALALATLGLYQVRAGHPSLGKPKAKEGLDIALKSGNKLILAKCLVAYARSFDAAIATEESIPYIREAIAIVEELQTEPLYLSDLYGLLGIHLDAPEDAAESEELLRNALETSRKYYPPDHPEIVGDLYTFAQRLQANNKYEESRATVEEAYALALKIYPPEHYMPHRLAAMQLEILVYDEQWDEAEKVCQEIVAFAPDNAGPWTLYGHVLAKRGDVKGAIEKFKRAVEHSGDHPANWEGYWDLAIALLYDGRIEEYCTHCHEFLMRSAHTNEFGIAEVTAKAALMLPVQGPDFELACRLADFAGECTEPKWLLPWIQLTKSLADYRRDRFESAIDWAGRSANSKSAELECRAAALCVKACCYAQLGQFDLAEALLSESEAVRAEATDPASRRSIVWRDWTAVELIRHEAAERIEQASAIPQP